MRVPSLGQADPLEEEVLPTPVCLPGELQSIESQSWTRLKQLSTQHGFSFCWWFTLLYKSLESQLFIFAFISYILRDSFKKNMAVIYVRVYFVYVFY